MVTVLNLPKIELVTDHELSQAHTLRLYVKAISVAKCSQSGIHSNIRRHRKGWVYYYWLSPRATKI